MKLNKKAIIGSGLATVWAIVVIAIILAIFFLLSAVILPFKKTSENVIVTDKFTLIENSESVIALLNTPFEISLSGETVKVPLKDIFILYDNNLVSNLDMENIKPQIKTSLEKAYGSCYAIKYEGTNIFEDNWQTSAYAEKWQQQGEITLTEINLISGKFSFRNLFDTCMIKNRNIENCKMACLII
ncbi:MAG: hypothetical protein KJ767_03610 [Nanoarchaeota archaeon]|nr:hypothetical protein [Nanoarchaeota archaeon]